MKKSTLVYAFSVFWLLAVIVISYFTLRSEKARNPFPIEFDYRQKGMDSLHLSVPVPDGLYELQVVLGHRKESGLTTVKAEAQHLYLENVYTAAGEYSGYRFCVFNRDACLHLEFSGAHPQVAQVVIRPAKADVPLLFFCGNAVAAGQLLPGFFNYKLCVADFAESGETVASFSAGHWQTIKSMIRPGDYLLLDFGPEGPNQADTLKQLMDTVCAAGATPILSTCQSAACLLKDLHRTGSPVLSFLRDEVKDNTTQSDEK